MPQAGPSGGLAQAPAAASALSIAGLSAAEALALVERGADADRMTRAVLLHDAARPGADGRSAPLGDLDRAAWALRRASIGGVAEAQADCGSCGAVLEIVLPDAFAPPPRAADHARVAHDGRDWRVRLPCADDFAGGALRVERLADGAPWTDDAFLAKAEAALDAADPGMDLRLSLTCAECGAAVEAPFDAAAFFWRELETLERRLIGEVALLAAAFGWSEAEILALPPRRRALYLAEAGR